MRILIVENLPANVQPWWWPYLPEEASHHEITIVGLAETSNSTILKLLKLVRLWWTLVQYDLVITYQDSYATFVFALLHSVFRVKRCRHMVQEFITRERSDDVYSRLKYRFLRFVLNSVDLITCSSRSEIEYYRQNIALTHPDFQFLPLSTHPRFAELETSTAGDYIASAGRTGRDYRTLLTAMHDLQVRLELTVSPKDLEGLTIPDNVVVHYDLPQDDLVQQMADAKFIVIPLANKPISIGQSVIIIAMLLGKAVITSRCNATIDYVEHGRTGLLVEPENPIAMRMAIEQLLADPDLAMRLGSDAQKRAKETFVPAVNLKKVCGLLALLMKKISRGYNTKD